MCWILVGIPSRPPPVLKVRVVGGIAKVVHFDPFGESCVDISFRWQASIVSSLSESMGRMPMAEEIPSPAELSPKNKTLHLLVVWW